jgi:hypothetical protein
MKLTASKDLLQHKIRDRSNRYEKDTATCKKPHREAKQKLENDPSDTQADQDQYSI